MGREKPAAAVEHARDADDQLNALASGRHMRAPFARMRRDGGSVTMSARSDASLVAVGRARVRVPVRAVDGMRGLVGCWSASPSCSPICSIRW